MADVDDAFDLSDGAAVERFREYLRCDTSHPDPRAGYALAAALFERYAAALGLRFERLEGPAPGHPTLILTWEGSAPELPSVVLSGHMDVVPAERALWSVEPFAAELRDGLVYGRGAQDMKSVSIQYLEAIARLKRAGFAPRRSLHVLLVPDEEVGGLRGMQAFLRSERVRAMNPALVLDEGLASPTDKFTVFYGERKIWWIRVTATGAAGHGSRFIEGTAVVKLTKVIDKLLAFREAQRRELEATCHCGKQLGDFTSVNCTMLSAGEADPAKAQYNAIPTTAVAGFDVRIPATVDLAEFKKQLDAWCSQDEGVSYEPLPFCAERFLENPVSDVSEDSRWWRVFRAGLAAAGAETHEPSIFPAASDSRWVRLMLGVPCFGFSPMRRTPILLHDHDEHLSVRAFVEGVGVYEKLLPVLANEPEPAAAAAAAAAAATAATS
jgi:aminoacylase